MQTHEEMAQERKLRVLREEAFLRMVIRDGDGGVGSRPKPSRQF